MPAPPRVQLQFQDAFENSEDAIPLFLTHQGIKGCLKLSDVSSRSVVVKFTFCGDLTNSIGFENYGNLPRPNLSLKTDIYKCSIVHELDPSSSSCVVPFHFPFDRRFLRCDELFEKSVIFPPSLEVNSLRLGQRGGYAKVHYTLKATVISAGASTVTTSREVRVVDETVPQGPPIWLEGFGNEYICNQQRTLRNMLGLPQGQLLVTAAEPQPIKIHRAQKRSFAEIPLKFTFLGSPPSGTIVKSWTALLDWSLKASTFVSTIATRALPTVAQAKTSPFLRVIEDTISEGTGAKMNLTFQRAEKSTYSGTRTWTAESLVSLDIVPPQLPPPTISSRFLSRRYNISLLIKPSGEGTCVLELNIPVQITYAGELPGGHRIPSRLLERESIDTVLPQYVS